MKTTIVLLNYDAPHAYPAAVTGRSGKVYGHATYDASRSAMCFRMPLTDWRSGSGRDIVGNMHRPLSRWVPDFEVEHEASDKTDRERELEDAITNLQKQIEENALRSLPPPALLTAAEAEAAETVAEPPPSPEQLAIDARWNYLRLQPFRSLRMLASELQVENLDAITEPEQLIAAILEKEKQRDAVTNS